jgi:MYXO-CTERM domain-containing protein
MRCLRYLPLPLSLISLLLPSLASAEPWIEDKVFFTETAKLGSSMVDAADLDGDGWIDLVFANGGGYDKGDMLSDLPQQAFKNEAGTATTDISKKVFGDAASYNGRAVKIRDIDRDGDNDIMLGVTWQKQSQLYLNSDGQGTFINETLTHLPQFDASIGDLELGDVDGDGDLDMVLADWGPDAPVGDPVSTEGGTTQLWLQDGDPGSFSAPGTGIFVDATLDKMPLDKIRWSWDLEFVDIDNDYDLDVAVSCFACTKQSLFVFANDGGGSFTNVTGDTVDQGLGAFDVEVMDLNGDSFLDLLTLRDGTGGRNRILLSDKMGGFNDDTDLVWPKLENPASFDHMGAFLDYNSDGKTDIVVGAFNPGKVYPDRLIENQGNNTFKQNIFAFNVATPATYALVLADFNKDFILDVAQAQNENAFDKRVFIGSNVDLLPDSAAPVFNNYEKLADDIEFGIDHTLRARVHDNKSPLMLHDFRDVDGEQNGRPYVESWGDDPGDPELNPGAVSAPGEWYGEYLWRVTFNVPKDVVAFYYRMCAIDAAKNKYCTGVEHVDNPDTSTTTSESSSTTDPGTSSSTTTTSESNTDTAGTTVDPTTGPLPTTEPIDPTTSSDSETAGVTTLDTLGELDDDGCGCDVDESGPRGVLASLALLGLLGLRRRRQS